MQVCQPILAFNSAAMRTLEKEDERGSGLSYGSSSLEETGQAQRMVIVSDITMHPSSTMREETRRSRRSAVPTDRGGHDLQHLGESRCMGQEILKDQVVERILEHVAPPAPAVLHDALLLVIEDAAPAPAVTRDALGLVMEHVAPAAVTEYVSPALALTHQALVSVIEYVEPPTLVSKYQSLTLYLLLRSSTGALSRDEAHCTNISSCSRCACLLAACP